MKIYLRLLSLALGILLMTGLPGRGGRFHYNNAAYAENSTSFTDEFELSTMSRQATYAVDQCFKFLDTAFAENMSVDVSLSFARAKHQINEELILHKISRVDAEDELALLETKRTEFFSQLSQFHSGQEKPSVETFKNFCESFDALGFHSKTNSGNHQSLCECMSAASVDHSSSKNKCMTKNDQIEFCSRLPAILTEHHHGHSEEQEAGEESSAAGFQRIEVQSLTTRCEDLFK